MVKINKKIIRFFDALADETRLKILVAISKKPTTVNEIHKKFGNITLSAISHQLRLLSDLNIVKSVKKGRKKYYSLSKDYCWCILRDAFNSFREKVSCPNCSDIEKQGGLIL